LKYYTLDARSTTGKNRKEESGVLVATCQAEKKESRLIYSGKHDSSGLQTNKNKKPDGAITVSEFVAGNPKTPNRTLGGTAARDRRLERQGKEIHVNMTTKDTKSDDSRHKN
jgi:hypothetical protein